MEQEDAFSYSPFHSASRFTPRNQALLVQFTLAALAAASYRPLLEHLRLFPLAFSDQEEAVTSLAIFIKKRTNGRQISPRSRKEGVRKLIPFLHLCKSDESLWLFLVKQGCQFDTPKNILALLRELYPEDLSAVSLRMSSHFSARGFNAAAKECIFLFHNLQQNHA